jgi:hypothetical protein
MENNMYTDVYDIRAGHENEAGKTYTVGRLKAILRNCKRLRVVINGRREEFGCWTCHHTFMVHGPKTVWTIDTDHDGVDAVISLELHLMAIMVWNSLTRNCVLGDMEFSVAVSIAWDMYENFYNSALNDEAKFFAFKSAFGRSTIRLLEILEEAGWVKKDKGIFGSTQKMADALGYQPDFNPLGEYAQYY